MNTTQVHTNDTHYFTLAIPFCLLVDLPRKTWDCSTPSSLHNETYCFQCRVPGPFSTGERLDDHHDAGHVICIIFWLLCLTIGVCGTFGNYLIITILRQHKERRSFDSLLLILACVDMLSTVSSALSATGLIIFFENWDRSVATIALYCIPFMSSLLGRSASSFMTVLITIERYVTIKFYASSSRYFSAKFSKIMAGGVIVLAILLNIPRSSSGLIVRQFEGAETVPSLRGLKHIIITTPLDRFWYIHLGSVHYQIDMWLPFPVLIIFNVLLFIEIKKFTKRRQALNMKQKTDIRAARMFAPVVIVLFFCNIIPIITYLFIHFNKVFYRELLLGLLLSIAANSAANLPIYYARGSSFRKEIRAALPPWIQSRFNGKNGVNHTNPTVTGNTESNQSS